jgi:hypothetical protein
MTEVKIYNNTEDKMEITTKDRAVNVTPSTHASRTPSMSRFNGRREE